jgi:hypothetical protein
MLTRGERRTRVAKRNETRKQNNKKKFGCSGESSIFATTVKVNDSRESLTGQRLVIKSSPKIEAGRSHESFYLLQPPHCTIRANR